jgi:hypothetical protein
MPNWCSNEFAIVFVSEGQKEQFLRRLESRTSAHESFDFDVFVPMPSILRSLEISQGPKGFFVSFRDSDKTFRGGGSTGTPEQRYFDLDKYEIAELNDQHGTTSWYDWAIEHWGTKWNASSTIVDNEVSGTEVSMQFETAWSPPIPVAKAISEQFPGAEVTLNFLESGCDFGGCVRFVDGVGTDRVDVSARESREISDWHRGAYGEDPDDDEHEEQEVE